VDSREPRDIGTATCLVAPSLSMAKKIIEGKKPAAYRKPSWYDRLSDEAKKDFDEHENDPDSLDEDETIVVATPGKPGPKSR
jgi:hypothetical protein